MSSCSVHSTLLFLPHFTFLQVPNGIVKENVYNGRHWCSIVSTISCFKRHDSILFCFGRLKTAQETAKCHSSHGDNIIYSTKPSIKPGTLPPPPVRAAPMVIDKDKTVPIKGMQKAMVSLNILSVILAS